MTDEDWTDELYRALVEDYDLPAKGVMDSDPDDGLTSVHAVPDVSGVKKALDELGFQFGQAGGGEFPATYTVRRDE